VTTGFRETLAWEAVQPGDALDPLVFPLTYRNLIIDASGTRDLYPIHHDRDFARSQGQRDVFINTMMYEGLFGRLITDWAGPEAFLRRLKFAMRAPNCPGDTITSRAWVVAKYERDGDKLVDVEAHLDNQLEPDTTIAHMTVLLH
jgi:acyl dehydratase